MRNIQKILENKRHLKILAVIFSFILILFFNPLSSSVNKTVENIFQRISGKVIPDTNIIIIHIDENDIQKLGGWPLKRSYYALLLNYLNKFEIKAAGIEVFFSDSYTFQSVYNDLLIEQILKKKNVILGSQIGSIYKEDGRFQTDSIFHPYLKMVNSRIKTGHLNYQSGPDIFIPAKVYRGKRIEKSFSSALAEFGKENLETRNFAKVNFNTSWKDYKKFSMLEFFDLAEKEKISPAELKNKIVIIGVSDPSTAKSISTPFDEVLPGVGLHAIAADNLLTNRGIKGELKLISLIILFGVFIALAYHKFEMLDVLCYLITFSILIAISCILFAWLRLEVNYSAIVFPFVFLVGIETVIYFLESKHELSESISEREILSRALKAKEENLLELERELGDASNLSSGNLVVKISALKNEIARLKDSEEDNIAEEKEIDEPQDFEGIIYKSSIMNSLVNTIKKVAPTDASILVLGESGSGKELVASALHNLSKRKDENFLAINCAALTDSLLESELFGHLKGSFTNAIADKKGMFEAANKGTIFLDEIGETSEGFQAKLLRVLQSGEIQKVGGTEAIFVDVRVVAATNKSLENLVKEKRFREDLYYRLNVIQIKLPALDERKEDIKILANYFAQKEDSNLSISKAVIKQLEENKWRGNVRELESIVKRAAIFAKSEQRSIIKLSDLPKEMIKQNKADLEDLILESLREKEFSHSSINETAKELGNLSRTIISENFRGIFFKCYINNEFDLEAAVKEIAQSEELGILEKVESKVTTYLKNIEKDVNKINTEDFEQVKKSFNSKYKNLPQKYHFYLDQIIKYYLS